MDLKRAMLYPDMLADNTPEGRERAAAAAASMGLPVQNLPPSYAAATAPAPSSPAIPPSVIGGGFVATSSSNVHSIEGAGPSIVGGLDGPESMNNRTSAPVGQPTAGE